VKKLGKTKGMRVMTRSERTFRISPGRHLSYNSSSRWRSGFDSCSSDGVRNKDNTNTIYDFLARFKPVEEYINFVVLISMN
jgi:hypothetical protein